MSLQLVFNPFTCAFDYVNSTSGGSGPTSPTSGIVNGSNTVFTFATAPQVICVDNGRIMQQVSSDGTINWTGTTTINLTIAPNYDIFAISSGTSSSTGNARYIFSISTNTTAGSALDTDYIYLASSTLTLTLPDASSATGRYTIKNVGTGIITINPVNGQTIDGLSSLSLSIEYTSVDLISDGNNWYIT